MGKNKVTAFVEEEIAKRYEKDTADKILKDFRENLKALEEENAGESEAVKAHTFKKMYPSIAIYKAMQQEGIDKEEAYNFLCDYYYADAQKDADSMKALLKIPFLYKAMPFMWKKVTVSMFGTDAGFKFNFYDVKSRVKFDMVKCPYFETFNKYGCGELTKILCHTDDIKNGGIHPKLIWNRSKTLGSGDDLCDFDLIVK